MTPESSSVSTYCKALPKPEAVAYWPNSLASTRRLTRPGDSWASSRLTRSDQVHRRFQVKLLMVAIRMANASEM